MASKPKALNLHPKFGVNPTIDTCFWCGNSKGVALMGNNYRPHDKPEEAPQQLVLDYNECPNCATEWARGTAIIEVSPQPLHNGQGAISHQGDVQYYPTGRVCIVTSSWAIEALDTDATRVLVSIENFSQLLGMTPNQTTHG